MNETTTGIEEQFRLRLEALTARAGSYLAELEQLEGARDKTIPLYASSRTAEDVLLSIRSAKQIEEATDLKRQCLTLITFLIESITRAPLVTPRDVDDLRKAGRTLVAALDLREYSADHDDKFLHSVSQARLIFDAAIKDVLRLLILVHEQADPSLSSPSSTDRSEFFTRPNTAFIMMSMNPNRPELDDVQRCIKEVFGAFGIHAQRADDIEHGDVITTRLLKEIRESEFLIADLTGGRPSVYYEIGYAHALGKRVHLYRKKGTLVHFDLSVHNAPEYRNMTELREMLIHRVEAITGKTRPPQSP